MQSHLLLLTASLLATLVIYHIFKIGRWLYLRISSCTPMLRGPPNPSFLFGNLQEIWSSTSALGEANIHERWHECYGHTYSTRGPIGSHQIVTMDTKAMQHVMRHEHIYGKTPGVRILLKMILGEGSGILVAEGEKHKMQRKVMNPAFGKNQIRELAATFFEKSLELRDIWAAHITAAGGVAGRVDSFDFLSKATLDVIGLCGFNYHFNALNDQGRTNELNQAFSSIFRSSDLSSIWIPFQAQLPIQSLLRALASIASTSGASSAMASSAKIMQRTARELLLESKAYLAGTGGKNDNWGARDLLSLLLRSNMSTDIPAGERMSDEDVIAQVPTFLIAGHETTSVSTTLALFSLSHHQEKQAKLRKELLSVATATPSMDELDELPYLDAFIRETLRLFAPLTNIHRIALQDDMIPLAHPITDSEGKVHNSIPVHKGQSLNLSLLGVNMDKMLWGPDAHEFKPERWLNVPENVHTVPGVWSNLMTFWGGTRSCIGWRFSTIEMKALLFTLVRSFEFELAVPAEELIVFRVASMQRPSLNSGTPHGALPLLIKPLRTERL